MALERSQQEQQEAQLQQQQRQEERQEQQQREAAEVGGGGSPAAASDISSSSDAEAWEPRTPVYPLLAIPVPPELADSAFVGNPVDIDHRCRVPNGWQRCLSLKTGKIFYKDPFNWEDDDMSRNGKNRSLDLRLNLSAYRGSSSGTAGGSSNNNNNINNNNSIIDGGNNSPHHSSSSSSSSPPSSCVSSETEQEGEPSSMVLVGCPHCLMYVMLSEEDPKCPKCKSTVLLDFLNDPKNPGAPSTRKAKKN